MELKIEEPKNIEKLLKEYKENINCAKRYQSYINQVREYKGYIFKETRDTKKFNNEVKWLNKLMNVNYNTPKIYGTDNEKNIIMEKIEGQAIKDDNANEHLYNIGKLLANLHNIPVEVEKDWKDVILPEYNELKQLSKDGMENDIYKYITNFLDNELTQIKISKTAIIHRDLRPENVIYSNGEYYMIDLESMCIGDIDYDFTRLFNLFNQKEIYQYEDFENLINGYRSINDINISEDKWQCYNKLYAFRIYSKMLCGKINRDKQYEEYLKSTLLEKEDRVSKWIKKYNQKNKKIYNKEKC